MGVEDINVTQFLAQLLPTLGVVFAHYVRIEKRLTRVETLLEIIADCGHGCGEIKRKAKDAD
jgi:hypothetical protein